MNVGKKRMYIIIGTEKYYAYFKSLSIGNYLYFGKNVKSNEKQYISFVKHNNSDNAYEIH